MDSNILNYSCLEPLNVSRETFPDLEEFRQIIIQKNRSINLISKQSEQVSKERHIIDSAQIIDFIDLNLPICTDIGSGSGLPGIVLAIIMKHKKSEMKFKLYEKSYHKSNFLKEVSNKFNLNVEVLQKDIFEQKNLRSDIIVARAFKPLPIILNLIYGNFKFFKEVILFLGKNAKEMLRDVLKEWEFEYQEKKSITSDDSIILKISKLKKR
ncbi:MAG: 16S rRNA (guanine(527)-N(7))-methyltransferase RsmG [Rickettsiales bacterium]|nr:16S rRNA (guanine(527)-N(7))-methyltransferase RsmG [Rickettsiales bacterium]